jgi:hypothetical protein
MNLKFLFFIFLSSQALAFPEMIRHGYNNCLTCHLSPGGGGTLTNYGRELSKEALSQYSGEKEHLVFGSIEPSEDYLLGGDARSIYRYMNSSTSESGTWIPMQAELAAFWTGTKNWIFGLAVGPERVSSTETIFSSRIHYLGYQSSDELRIRAGKFPMTYGLMIPEHFSSIRRNIGFDQGTEPYNIEISYISEYWNQFFSYSFGRLDRWQANQDVGPSLVTAYNFNEKMKVGISVFIPETSVQKRFLVGPFLIWSFQENWYLLSEIDSQNRTVKSSNTVTNGTFAYMKLGKEIHKGIVPFAEYELSFTDLNDSSTKSQVYGIGLQYFPRPHWQLDLNVQKRADSPAVGVWTDYAYILFHYYF